MAAPSAAVGDMSTGQADQLHELREKHFSLVYDLECFRKTNTEQMEDMRLLVERRLKAERDAAALLSRDSDDVGMALHAIRARLSQLEANRPSADLCLQTVDDLNGRLHQVQDTTANLSRMAKALDERIVCQNDELTKSFASSLKVVEFNLSTAISEVAVVSETKHEETSEIVRLSLETLETTLRKEYVGAVGDLTLKYDDLTTAFQALDEKLLSASIVTSEEALLKDQNLRDWMENIESQLSSVSHEAGFKELLGALEQRVMLKFADHDERIAGHGSEVKDILAVLHETVMNDVALTLAAYSTQLSTLQQAFENFDGQLSEHLALEVTRSLAEQNIMVNRSVAELREKLMAEIKSRTSKLEASQEELQNDVKRSLLGLEMELAKGLSKAFSERDAKRDEQQAEWKRTIRQMDADMTEKLLKALSEHDGKRVGEPQSASAELQSKVRTDIAQIASTTERRFESTQQAMTQLERVLTDRVAQVAADVDAKGRVSADLYEVLSRSIESLDKRLMDRLSQVVSETSDLSRRLSESSRITERSSLGQDQRRDVMEYCKTLERSLKDLELRLEPAPRKLTDLDSNGQSMLKELDRRLTEQVAQLSKRADTRHDDLQVAVKNSLNDLSNAIQDLDRASTKQMSKLVEQVNQTNTGNVATVTTFIETMDANLRRDICQVSDMADANLKEQQVAVGCLITELDNRLVREINHVCAKQATVINRSLEEVDSRLTELSSENLRISEVQEKIERRLDQECAISVQAKVISEDPITDPLPTFDAKALERNATRACKSTDESGPPHRTKGSEPHSPKTLRVSRVRASRGYDVEKGDGFDATTPSLSRSRLEAH
mmetsp:Transcript_29647/g.78559  ORF Transcript_29647/g.78559 Transcript_29647/m.78559 type:complete len:840 (-) Transcript_29647:396-2915(-)